MCEWKKQTINNNQPYYTCEYGNTRLILVRSAFKTEYDWKMRLENKGKTLYMEIFHLKGDSGKAKEKAFEMAQDFLKSIQSDLNEMQG